MTVDAVVRESDATQDARLVGTWAEVNGKSRATVTLDGGVYAIEFTDDDGAVVHYEARLGQLGGAAVLDVQVSTAKTPSTHAEVSAMIRGHQVVRVQVSGDTASIALLKTETLKQALSDKSVTLEYISDQDRLILLGNTAALRATLGPYVRRPGAFDDAGEWRRVKP